MHQMIVIYKMTLDEKTGQMVETAADVIRLEGSRLELVPYQFPTLKDAEDYRAELRRHLGVKAASGASGKRKRVRWCQTGDVFPSAAAAARYAGVSASAVKKYLKHPSAGHIVRGCTFEYVS